MPSNTASAIASSTSPATTAAALPVLPASGVSAAPSVRKQRSRCAVAETSARGQGSCCGAVEAPHWEQRPRPASPDPAAISAYWDARATSYSRSVLEELGGAQHRAWARVLEERSAAAREAAVSAGRRPRALDLGCGPGFFSILLARLGCAVDAVDSSCGMLAQARRNNRAAGTAGAVAFHEGDVAHLPFADGLFDVVALRNVTWLMRDPVAAYREWRRVLAPGGTLLVFDANWYRYLADPVVDAQRIVDQADGSVLGQDESCLATSAQERRCEELALGLPFTYVDRPAWDVRALADLGFARVSVDADAWRAVWTEGEKAFYGSSPLFLIQAVK